MTFDLFTSAGLTAAFATSLSLVFILVPGARTWFEALSKETQEAVVGVSILAIAAAAVGLGCAGVIVFIPCTVASIGEYVGSVVVAAIIGDRTAKSFFAGARFVATRRMGAAERSLSQPKQKLLG